jgi:clan AA aspartic protease (TIGR02281 family)
VTASKQTDDASEIRFRLCEPDHLILVKVYVNDAGPFDFIFDTGASMTVISPATARAAGIGEGGRKAKALGANGQLDARVIRLRSLRIGSVETRNISGAIMNMASLNRTMKLRLGGIIGYNLLRRYRLTIDYPKRRVWLECPSNRTVRRL